MAETYRAKDVVYDDETSKEQNMIAHNTHHGINKRLAHAKTQVQAARSVAAMQRNAQQTLNAILWQLINQTVEDALEDGQEASDGPPMLTLPIADLKEIPGNFGLTLKKNDDDTISVIAVLVKPKGNIILPGKG